MVNNKLIILIVIGLTYFTIPCQAGTEPNHLYRYPVYVGVTGGYGSTTWEMLVPSVQNQNAAIRTSVPTHVNEGDAVWGLFAGYEFNPHFALETSYMHYHSAKVSFDATSYFTFEHNGLTDLNTQTETTSLIAKIMLTIPRTRVKVYSGVGAAAVHRHDEITNRWRLSPTFSAGINYKLTPHIMAELGGSYTAGYAKSELDPAEDYFPFLYSGFLRLAYCF
jgi:opacity protein-like surface antigen